MIRSLTACLAWLGDLAGAGSAGCLLAPPPPMWLACL
jgi:hypothetical protein